MSRGPGLVIIPHCGLPELTAIAIADARAQLGGECDVLVVRTGGKPVTIAGRGQHMLWWDFVPPPTSLSAVWNVALDFAWQAGYPDAMVWNNDVRVSRWMYEALRQLRSLRDLQFISPINCRDANPEAWSHNYAPLHDQAALGGPDFSCFLITPALHRAFRFDERFIPCYHEDNDFARRVWLAGRGAEIAAVPVPYLHTGSATINSFTPEQRADFHRRFSACQQTYVAKWGGLPHQERKITPDTEGDMGEGLGTPGGWLGATPVPEVAMRVRETGTDRG